MTGPVGLARVRWSASLPEGDGGHLAVLSDSRVLVSGRRFLTALRPGGEVDWLVGSRTGLVGAPVVLPDGHITRYEDGRLVTRDPGTGAAVAELVAPGLTGVTSTDDGELVYDTRSDDGSPVLRRATADGTVRWSVPLMGPPSGSPVVTDQVMVADGPLIRGYDPAGTPLWVAGERGFGRPDRAAGPVVGGTVRGELVVLPGGRLLAELSGPDGAGCQLFDPATRTVRPLGAPLALRPPVAVCDGRLAMLGPAEEIERQSWLSTVLLVEDSGTVRWRHRLGVEPTALLAGAGGIFVVASPGVVQWQRYHGWQDLSDRCFVRCLDDTGAPRWTWPAPGPLTYRPAADATTCYVAAPGMLWALNGEVST